MPDATTSSHAALARVVEEQRTRLANAWREATHGEADALRRVRIATRRLREVVGFARQLRSGFAGKRVARDLRRISRALGRARELTVARGDLDRAARAHGWPPDVSGPLARWLDRQAARAIREMRTKLRRVDIGELDAKLAVLAVGLDEVARGSKQRGRLATALMRRAVRVQKTRARCGALYEPDQMHALRIAIKKLRYVTELTGALTAAPLEPLVARLKREQRRLGRLHDRQMLLLEVQTCAAASRGPAAMRLAPVIDALERDCRRWYGDAIASLAQVDATAADALRAAATTSRPARGRPARARLAATADPRVLPARRHTA